MFSIILLVPGFGGTRMEARLNKALIPNIFCFKNSDWFTIWVNMEILIPFLVDCWVENIKLVYNNQTRHVTNVPGVETRIPNWGSTSTVEYLDTLPLFTDPYSIYLKGLCDALASIGYVRDVNILSAPYDFRKAPNDNDFWLNKTIDLIENTYQMNDHVKITLICHSLGCLNTLNLLHVQPQAWKDKFVLRLITLGGPWGGSMKALKVFAMGDNIDVSIISAAALKSALSSWPSMAWMLPSAKIWNETDVLASTMSRTYTVNDYEQFFKDLGDPIGWEMRKDTEKYLNPDLPPNVEVHCLFGDKLFTTERLNYESESLSGTPELVHGDGDGVVNIKSLRGCEKWVEKQEKSVNITVFPKLTHYFGMVTNPQVLKYIKNVLSE